MRPYYRTILNHRTPSNSIQAFYWKIDEGGSGGGKGRIDPGVAKGEGKIYF